MQGLTPPPLWLQSESGGCALTFGPRGSSVVTVPRERLQAGVEYTFNLTVWKAGRKEEATNQTVGAAGLVLSPARQSPRPPWWAQLLGRAEHTGPPAPREHRKLLEGFLCCGA